VSVLHVGLCRRLMPKNLRRYYGHGDLQFITFSCYRQLPLQKTARARDVFVQAMGKIREMRGTRSGECRVASDE